MDRAVSSEAYCGNCMSLMVEDNGAGHLCPGCDRHPPSECGTEFPCSGFDGKPCALNATGRTDEAVTAIAEELARHGHDSMSQDSGQHCICGSDSRFQQLRGKHDDPPWKTIDHHTAQQVLETLRFHMDISEGS